jgi:hypothetical protein
MDEQAEVAHLKLCQQHDALLTAWFPFDLDLAISHTLRLWLERNLQWYWRMRPAVYLQQQPMDEIEAQRWMAKNCQTVAAGCPICHDVHPDALLARISCATKETLLGAYPYWRVGSDVMRVQGMVKGRAGYLASLHVMGTEVKREDSPEPWWN